jgi:hypothetical protein
MSNKNLNNQRFATALISIAIGHTLAIHLCRYLPQAPTNLGLVVQAFAFELLCIGVVAIIVGMAFVLWNERGR